MTSSSKGNSSLVDVRFPRFDDSLHFKSERRRFSEMGNEAMGCLVEECLTPPAPPQGVAADPQRAV